MATEGFGVIAVPGYGAVPFAGQRQAGRQSLGVASSYPSPDAARTAPRDWQGDVPPLDRAG